MNTSLQDLVDALELRQVYATDLSGSRSSGSEATSFRYNIEPQFRHTDELVDYRYTVHCQPCDAGDQPVADLVYTVIASYEIIDAAVTANATDELLAEFGDQIALYAAYPYLRVGVQDVASRLNLPGITLGLLRRNEALPEGMTLGPLGDPDLEG